MLILGIETSCDETSVALIEDGRFIRSNYIASQIKLHAEFGGVVPELASRAHIQKLIPMVEECLAKAGISLCDVDAIGVTRGPGLIGALLVGVETGKALGFAAGKPVIPVNHVAGHLYAPFLVSDDPGYKPIVVDGGKRCDDQIGPDGPLVYPYMGLIVSGGHTSLVAVKGPGIYELLGETVDDAAGEAFDKVAKLLDLGYPGGPVIDRLAKTGNRRRFPFPRPMLHQKNLDFSFSGLKTAVLSVVRDLGVEAIRADEQLLADLCASFQEAVTEVLFRKAEMAMKQRRCRELAVVGGVACNSRIREAAAEYVRGARVVFPAPTLCADNAAMIAGLAFHMRDGHGACDLTMNAEADLPVSRPS